MTRSILLTFFPIHPSKMVQSIEEIQCDIQSIPFNKHLYFNTETREKVYCNIETLELFHRELLPISSIVIYEDLIPTGIFNISDINDLINKECETIELKKDNVLDIIRQIALDNSSTILAFYYIKERLLSNNTPYVEIKYV